MAERIPGTNKLVNLDIPCSLVPEDSLQLISTPGASYGDTLIEATIAVRQGEEFAIHILSTDTARKLIHGLADTFGLDLSDPDLPRKETP